MHAVPTHMSAGLLFLDFTPTLPHCYSGIGL